MAVGGAAAVADGPRWSAVPAPAAITRTIMKRKAPSTAKVRAMSAYKVYKNNRATKEEVDER